MSLTRDGLNLVLGQHAEGLDLAVAPSTRAIELAHHAHRDLVAADVLTWVGYGIGILGLVGGYGTFVALNMAANSSTVQAPALGWVSLGLFLVGAGVFATSIWPGEAGRREVAEAVDAYNQDLLDRRIGTGQGP